jgi:hypothetical protein
VLNKIADRGGSVAACFRMSSKDKSFNQLKDVLLAYGWNARRCRASQYCSIGELPITTDTFVVSGSTCRMFSMAPTKSSKLVMTVSFLPRLGGTRLSSTIDNMGVEAKNCLAYCRKKFIAGLPTVTAKSIR